MSEDAPALLARLEARDRSLWPANNVSPTRLGWLEVPRRIEAEAANIHEWTRTVDQQTVVLLGMGGSSLGPAVLGAAKGAGVAKSGDHSGAPRRLVVCDTTHPITVSSLDFSDAFVLVSSKSGTTLEPNALLAHAWSRLPDPSRYAAVTDPGTPLAKLAAERGFARCFENPPDIGGRYSVLSYFGMVPAALIGYDVADLCSRALSTDLVEAAALGMTTGEEARAGRDKLTVELPDAYGAFGLWVEQLVAESTGKQGTGCVPVPTTVPETGPDRHVVQLHPNEPADLGGQFYRWEVAVALCAHVLGIDPFDEPDVAESKRNTNDVLSHLPLPELEAHEPSGVLAWLADTFRPGDYVSLQAYLPFGHDAELETVRRAVRDHLAEAPVTAGYGPRFLHSTGQLHKGGPDSVVAVQIVSRTYGPEVPVPGKPYDFATLIAAQSVGDHRSLVARGRRVLRVALDDLAEIA
jgi:hypothetical protein